MLRLKSLSKQYVNIKQISSFQRCLSTSTSQFKDKYGVYINGKEVFPSNDIFFDVEEPATGKYICKVASADEKTVNEAIEIAHKTFQSGIWSKMDVRERAKIMNKIAENLRKEIPRLAEMEVLQTGRCVREMKAQLARLPEWFEYFAALIRTHEGTCPPFLGSYVNYVKRVPLGVCSLLTPWNHPMLIGNYISI